jgi:hypothetical protein
LSWSLSLVQEDNLLLHKTPTDLVTPRGFEPPTNRTGICHSIQLNYGAKK